MEPNFRKKFSNKKKPPNKAERIHMGKVAALGCCICKNNHVVLHHITEGRGFGSKTSAYEVIPLCVLHHDGKERGVSLHEGTELWESIYGTQEELLEEVMKEIYPERLEVANAK